MKLAIISDIHANLESLSEFFKRLHSYDIEQVICVGDIVGYGVNPNECIDLIKKNNVLCIQGDHDLYSAELKDLYLFNNYQRQTLSWTNKQLTKENKQFLKSLPKFLSFKNMYFVHGRPKTDLINYSTEKLIEKDLLKIDEKTLVVGHTHIPVIKKDKKTFLNPGSIGFPKDNQNKASFIIHDTERNSSRLIRCSYDISETIKKLKNNNIPEIIINRLKKGI